jgi:uncharacterized membrane protein YvlD (DUF360 family)
MDDEIIKNKPFMFSFRAILVVATVALFFGLRFHVQDTLFFCVVIIPIALAFVFSFWQFFIECKSRLIAFFLPVALLYSLGFFPWMTNFHKVALSSSTSALDFVIIPIWSTIYGLILLALHEVLLQIILWLRSKS